MTLPQLTGWKFASEAPEAQPGFDDSGWTLADHPAANASSPSAPVLYASDYGYDHGFVWGSDAQDPVRGIMNAAGLFGSGSGWDLPGYPDGSWENVTLPDSWSARGIPPGIGWYRTTFSLHRPADSYVPIDVQVGGPGRGADSVHGNGGLQGAHLCQRLADRTGT